MESPLLSRELLTKRRQESEPELGTSPYERPVEDLLKNSIAIIDKPPGPSSSTVTSWVKQLLGARKAGHAGTLDPGVSGVLPVLVDNATKIVQALQGEDKEYVCLLRLHSVVPQQKIRRVLESFRGVIRQKPPAKSAVKRVERERVIHEIEVLEIKDRMVLFRARVQAGTYMRVLCIDAARRMGTRGHMQELRRTMAGPFHEKQAVTLHELSEAIALYRHDGSEKLLRRVLRPLEEGVAHLPVIVVMDTAIRNLARGSPLYLGGVSMVSPGIEPGQLVAISSQKGELVALARATLSTSQILEKNRGIAATLERVVWSCF